MIESQEGQVDPDDPTEVDPDDPSQQSVERDRVEQERKLSSPEEAEGGEAGLEEDAEEGGEQSNQPAQEQGRPVQDNPQG